MGEMVNFYLSVFIYKDFIGVICQILTCSLFFQEMHLNQSLSLVQSPFPTILEGIDSFSICLLCWKATVIWAILKYYHLLKNLSSLPDLFCSEMIVTFFVFKIKVLRKPETA